MFLALVRDATAERLGGTADDADLPCRRRADRGRRTAGQGADATWPRRRSCMAPSPRGSGMTGRGRASWPPATCPSTGGAGDRLLLDRYRRLDRRQQGPGRARRAVHGRDDGRGRAPLERRQCARTEPAHHLRGAARGDPRRMVRRRAERRSGGSDEHRPPGRDRSARRRNDRGPARRCRRRVAQAVGLLPARRFGARRALPGRRDGAERGCASASWRWAVPPSGSPTRHPSTAITAPSRSAGEPCGCCSVVDDPARDACDGRRRGGSRGAHPSSPANTAGCSAVWRIPTGTIGRSGARSVSGQLARGRSAARSAAKRTTPSLSTSTGAPSSSSRSTWPSTSESVR